MLTAFTLAACATALAALVTLDFVRRVKAVRPELDEYLARGSDDA